MAKWHIDNDFVDAIVVPVASPNDIANGLLAQWSGVVSLVHYALSKGVIPVIKEMVPENSLTLSQDNERKELNSRINSLRLIGALVIKADALVSDGGAPARIVSTYSTDGRHLNSSGIALVSANAYVPVFRAIQTSA